MRMTVIRTEGSRQKWFQLMRDFRGIGKREGVPVLISCHPTRSSVIFGVEIEKQK